MSVTISGIRSTSTFSVANGGTGANTLTSGSLMVGNGTDPVGLIPPGNEGQILTVVNGEWAAADNAGGGGGGGGGGLSSITTSGNLQGNGTAGSPATLKANISLTSVTASFSGSGAALTNITASQIGGLSDAIDARITNIPNASLQNSSITINGSAVSLGGSATIESNTMEFTASGFAVGDVVALSGSLVKADNSNDMQSNAFGVVSAVNGNSVIVKMSGEATTSGASSIAGVGIPVYVGTAGAVVEYLSISSGQYITQVGFISPNSGKIIIQPRIFGQKA